MQNVLHNSAENTGGNGQHGQHAQHGQHGQHGQHEQHEQHGQHGQHGEHSTTTVTETPSTLHGGAGGNGKRPKKGILKSSSSFDRTTGGARKSAKFDELNVLQTFHPLDKDYGHMKIDEPKTPFNYGAQDPQNVQLDAELLAEKLRIAANTQTPSFGDDDVSDEDFEETIQEKAHRLEFEKRRKQHYKEFEAVKLARKLIEEELADEDDDDANNIYVVESDKSIAGDSSCLEECVEENENGVELNEVSNESHLEPSVTLSVSPPTQSFRQSRNNSMDVDQALPPKHPCHGKEHQ